MNHLSGRLLRELYVLVLLFCGAWLAMQALRHTGWYKQRLYAQLLTGDPRHQVMAAASLVQLEAEKELLAALKADTSETRETARRALEYLWFNSAGDEAFRLLQAAHEAAERDDHENALEILDRLTKQFPRFAEGWNRRAAVHWQRGESAKSMADCQRALALNPNHYGAWQGLGLCRLQQGEVAEACRCLGAALRILPHDPGTLEALERCKELLQSPPERGRRGMSPDLI